MTELCLSALPDPMEAAVPALNPQSAAYFGNSVAWVFKPCSKTTVVVTCILDFCTDPGNNGMFSLATFWDREIPTVGS